MSLTPKCDMFLKSSCLLQPIQHLPEAIQHIHPQSPPLPYYSPRNGPKLSKIFKKIIQNQPKSIKIVQYGPDGPKCMVSNGL